MPEQNPVSAAMEEGEQAASHGGHIGIPSPQALPSAWHAFLNLSRFTPPLPSHQLGTSSRKHPRPHWLGQRTRTLFVALAVVAIN